MPVCLCFCLHVHVFEHMCMNNAQAQLLQETLQAFTQLGGYDAKMNMGGYVYVRCT